jgi:hypothetical protein
MKKSSSPANTERDASFWSRGITSEFEEDSMAQCLAKTKNGTQCQNSARQGQKYCHIHRRERILRFTISASAMGLFLLAVLSFFADLTGILNFLGFKSPVMLNPEPSATQVSPNTLTPTITPIIAGAPPCLIEMKNDLVFADLNEIYAVIRNGALEIEPRFLDRYIALDSSCNPLNYFTIVATTKLESGNTANGFCVAFGPEPPQAGILKNNYAFCIDGNKNWLVGTPKGEGLETSQTDTSENLLPIGAENMLIVQHTPDGISFLVNGAPVGSAIPEGAIKEGNYYFGLGLGTSTDLPKWIVTGLKVYQYDPTQQSKSSPWHGFSNLDQRASSSSSRVVITLKKQQVNLSITQPVTLNYPVATYILMDASQSMVVNDKNNLGQALIRMILESAPPDDMLGLGLFGDGTSVIFPPSSRIFDLQPFSKIEDSIAKGFQRHPSTTNYVDALMSAVNQLDQIPAETHRRIILITDGALNNPPAQENDLSRVFLRSKQLGIDIDVILIRNQIGDDFLHMWNSLAEISIANHLFSVSNIREVAELVLKQYYYSHTFDNSDNSLFLTVPGEYAFDVAPNVEKMAMTFTRDITSDQPYDVYLASPTEVNYTMYADTIVSVSNPIPGQWRIVLQGETEEQIELQSLFLISIPPK